MQQPAAMPEGRKEMQSWPSFCLDRMDARGNNCIKRCEVETGKSGLGDERIQSDFSILILFTHDLGWIVAME
jgi:hypothetical protein